MRLIYLSILCLAMCIGMSSCELSSQKTKHIVGRMYSTPISIPSDKMLCWKNDSIKENKYWQNAELKLVHYIDPDRCTSCYLEKTVKHSKLLLLEKETSYKFVNIFIAAPNKKGLKNLKMAHAENNLPPIVFVDTAHIFVKFNPSVPSESIFHTFLLDKNNNVILVGNPLYNEHIYEVFVRIFNERIKNYKIKSKSFLD